MRNSVGAIAVILCMMTAVLSGCAGKQTDDPVQTDNQEETIVLKAFTMGKEPESGMTEFYRQLDALTTRDLNCIVRFDFIPWSEDKKKITQKIFSGEYDLYCGGNFSDFYSTANKHALLDLKPYLKHVPELVKRYQEGGTDVLQSFELDGKLYGIPGLGREAPVTMGAYGFLYREDLRKKWKLPPVTDLDTMEQYLYRAKADKEYKNAAIVTDSRIWTVLWILLAGEKYMEVTTTEEDPWMVVSFENPYTIVNRFETEEYKRVLEYAGKWYRDGIISQDILEMEENTTEREAREMVAGTRIAAATMGSWTLDSKIITPAYEKHPEWEWGYYDYVDIRKVPVYKSSPQGASCVSVNPCCPDPVTALKFIEKVHIDQEYYDLLQYGVEGINYHRRNNKVSTRGIEEQNVFPGWTGSSDGYMDSKNLESADPDWNQMLENKKKNGITPQEYSPLDGFSIDQTKNLACYTDIQKAYTRYFNSLQCGISNNLEEDMERASGQLTQAGLDQYLQEVQRQLNSFKRNKDKTNEKDKKLGS